MRIATYPALLLLWAACGRSSDAPPTTAQGSPASETPAGKAGAVHGQALADSLLAQWQLRNPGRDWEAEVRRSHPRIPPPADNTGVIASGQAEGQTYGRFSERDVAIWKRENERLVLEGARVFHDAEAMGSPVAVSCDMCHPDGANTHPETYPKFQVQMGRVALLRDMINWCLINPLRADAMAPDDPRMRAMEAYLLAQRKGVALDYGKH